MILMFMQMDLCINHGFAERCRDAHQRRMGFWEGGGLGPLKRRVGFPKCVGGLGPLHPHQSAPEVNLGLFLYFSAD